MSSPGHAAIGATEIAALEDETSNSPFVAACEAVVGDRVYLVELFPHQADGAAGDGVMPISEVAISALPDGEEGETGLASIYFSDRGWTSAPTDTVADTHFEGRARVPLVMDRTLPISPEQARRVALQFGAVELLNGDGDLDSVIARYAIDGRQVRVLMGAWSDAYADFGVIADVTGVRWEADGDRVRVLLRDDGYRLDVPLQTDIYNGTGSGEGTAEVEGKPKPTAFGKCLNVTPVLESATDLIYQCHAGQMQAIDAVYDQGAALTFSTTDHATYALLAAAVIAGGEYDTCLAEGFFRLGATPAGLVTADIQGDATGSYVSTAAEIAERIVRSFAGIAAADVDSDTFTTLKNASAGVVGLYVGTEEVRCADAVSEVVRGAGAWWGANRAGKIRVGRLEAPASNSPALVLDTLNILSLERVGQPGSIYPPNWRRRVGYQRNWTVQRGEDLAGAVTAARRQFLAEEFRAVASADVAVKTHYALATDPAPVPALFDVEADATAEASRLLALYSTERQLFAAKVKAIGHLVDLGVVVSVTWPRFGLEVAKAMRVVGIREDCDRGEVTLLVWG